MKKLWLSGAALLLSLICHSASAETADYGLPSKIEDGNILHCFSWPIKNIREELPDIAAAGFGSIQLSPLQRPDIDEGWTWYTIYLPYDYGVFGSPGMGSKDELRALCEEAKSYGIKIIVDVVLNHVNKTEPYYNPWWKDEQHNYYRTWGSEGQSIDYNNRWSITHQPLGDYVEINTENRNVIDRAKIFMEELRDLGVKGIRFDAAKHIELPKEGSDIWPEVTSVPGLWYYGEIVGTCVNGSDEAIKEYTKYIWVPDNIYTTKAARDNGGIPTESGGDRDSMTQGHLIYWAESHDDYSNDEWSERVNQSVIDRAYCAYACRNTQAALYYSRPRARGKENIKIEKGSSAFMSKQVVEVNKFRNAMVGRRDYFTHDNGVVSVTREGGGAVVVSKAGDIDVSIANGANFCPDGTYVDRVSGNTFTVASGKISGHVGPTGVAILYDDKYYKTTPEHAKVTITGDKIYNVAYAGNFSNGNNYIHYWKNNNESFGTTWPGVRMERALGSDGKYYWCYNVPEGADGIIFNNGGGSDAMQTADLPVISDYIMDNGGATIVPVEFKKGSFTPEPTGSTSKTITIEGDYNIVYSGDLEFIYCWDSSNNSNGAWPGETMDRVKGSDGNIYWCYKVPEGYTNVIFNNGKDGNLVKRQTADLKHNDSYVMSDAGATLVSVVYTIGGQPVNPEPSALDVVWPEDKYCYFYNQNNWSSPKAWAWISSSDKTNCGSEKSWPGDNMSSVASKYFWKATNKSVGMILFSDNGNDNSKTGDLSFVNGATYYLDGGHIGGDDFVGENPDRLYVLGTLTGHNWDPKYDGVEMKKIDKNGIYVAYNVKFDKASTDDPYAYFAFTDKTGSDWDDLNKNAIRYGAPTSNQQIEISSPTHIVRYSGDKSWKVPAGTYDIIVDLYDMTVTLLAPQSAPTVEALQLAEVQKATAEAPIKNYDYITYPAVNGQADGVTVNGDNIAVTRISVSDNVYGNVEDVRLTEKVLVTTTFTGTSAYNLDPRYASIGKKQSDGKFRGIRVLHNLDENVIESKVNYYYTLKEGVEVKVPMQTPSASARIRLAVPEPKLIHSGISVEKSSSSAPFTYEGVDFEAAYNVAEASVEIESPNVTEQLEAMTHNLFKVKVGENYMSGNSYSTQIISPDYFLTNEFSAPAVQLIKDNSGFDMIGRWQPSVTDSRASSISMTYKAPEITSVTGTRYSVEYVPVNQGDVTENHLVETVRFTLDVTTVDNTIIARNGDNSEIKTIDLSHETKGDWYLVEFYRNSDRVAYSVVEGNEGAGEFIVEIDNGPEYAGQYDAVVNSKSFDVYVSTLYPFIGAENALNTFSIRRAQGSNATSSVVESEAAVKNISVQDDFTTGIDSQSGYKDAQCEFYNLQGIKVARPETAGIYVVKKSDGSTVKILVK